ncbi:hypothetical protein ACTHAM_001186 [Cellulomonas soli]|uniref:hypothetical protein n=1 Tax=Cellulomonas soli TaxID=931535 RepID=UPI003F871C7D
MTARELSRAGWRPAVVGLVVGGAAGAVGVEASSAVVIGVVAALLVLAAERVGAGPDVVPEPVPTSPREGARGEVQELVWAMIGRDGRIGERPLRTLRRAAAVRLARHGVRLDDPADDDTVRALLGARAHRTLHRTVAPLPSVADVRHTLDALERLGSRPAGTHTDTGAAHEPAAGPTGPTSERPAR